MFGVHGKYNHGTGHWNEGTLGNWNYRKDLLTIEGNLTISSWIGVETWKEIPTSGFFD